MLNNLKTLRIKSLMVAIISMLIVSVLVSTISFNACGADDKDVANRLSYMNISSSSYAVMSGSTSEMVINQHAERKMHPGKIAMLVTAMLVIDKMYNDEELENPVVITEKMAEFGGTYLEGESVKVGDLMNAMLIGGDAQSAEALARYSASKGSVFVNLMNAKCQELRLMDTQFASPSGAYSTKQYSTAADLAVIMQAAMRYRIIKEAFAERNAVVSVSGKSGDRQIRFHSTNPLLNGTTEVYKHGRGGIMGSITESVAQDATESVAENADGGSVESVTEVKSISQFAGAAVRDDMQLIVVLMDSAENRVGEEAKKLLDFANTIVTRDQIVEAGKIAGHVMVRGGEKVRLPAYTESRGFAYVPPEGSKELIDTKIELFNNLEAPLKKGAKVGEFRIYVADELKGTVDLVLKENVAKGWLPSMIYISNTASIVIGVILGLLVLLLLRIMYVKRKRRKMRELKRRLQIREIAMRQMEIDEDRKKRNWTYGGSYDQFAPRTADIRKETLDRRKEKE